MFGIESGLFPMRTLETGRLILRKIAMRDAPDVFAYSRDPEMLAKSSVISALQLYLDFVNLFLYILRLMNSRRN